MAHALLEPSQHPLLMTVICLQEPYPPLDLPLMLELIPNNLHFFKVRTKFNFQMAQTLLTQLDNHAKLEQLMKKSSLEREL